MHFAQIFPLLKPSKSLEVVHPRGDVYEAKLELVSPPVSRPIDAGEWGQFEIWNELYEKFQKMTGYKNPKDIRIDVSIVQNDYRCVCSFSGDGQSTLSNQFILRVKEDDKKPLEISETDKLLTTEQLGAAVELEIINLPEETAQPKRRGRPCKLKEDA